jgi:hypothetical protein
MKDIEGVCHFVCFSGWLFREIYMLNAEDHHDPWGAGVKRIDGKQTND